MRKKLLINKRRKAAFCAVLLATTTFLATGMIGCGSKASNEETTASTEQTTEAEVTREITDEVIKEIAKDIPDGWAGVNRPAVDIDNSKIYKVTSQAELTKAFKENVSNGQIRIICISDEIDLNGGKTPYDYIKDAGLGSKYSSYEDWKEQFLASCTFDNPSSLQADQVKLHQAQTKTCVIKVPSDTLILGITDKAALINGSLVISNAKNVSIRNIRVWDSIDFFPPWYQSKENNFNADLDVIGVQDDSSYIWIDHCTIGNTNHTYDKVTIPENGGTTLDWVNYDGLCDITKGANYVTVSYNQFLNDDKTSLIGGSNSRTEDDGKLKVSIHNNYYDNVGQRLPRVRFGQVHVYNNNYAKVAPAEGSGTAYCIGVGIKAQIYSENNYFSENVKNSYYNMQSDNSGNITIVGDLDNSKEKGKAITELSKADWEPKNVEGYKYTVISAEEVKTKVTKDTTGSGVKTFFDKR